MDFTDPNDNVAHLSLEHENRVAVFGSGAGGHSLATARAMSGTGKIYAIDVRKDMLDVLQNNAKLEGFSNIESVHANIEDEGGTKIAPMSLNAVIVPNTLFSYEDRPGIFKEANRILMPKGKLLVVDWKDSYGGMGPQPEMVVKPEDAKQMAQATGFSLVEEFSAGAEHYGLVFAK